MTNLRNVYDFCKAMMEAAIASGNKQAIVTWDERAYDAYLTLHHEQGGW